MGSVGFPVVWLHNGQSTKVRNKRIGMLTRAGPVRSTAASPGTGVWSKRIVILTDERENESHKVSVEFHFGNQATSDRLPPESDNNDRNPGRVWGSRRG